MPLIFIKVGGDLMHKEIKINRDKTFKLEKQLQKYCMDHVKKLSKAGVPTMAMNQPAGPHNRRGVSDLILSIDGQFVAVELKNGRGNQYKPTELQLRFLKEVEDSGGIGEVIYSFAEFCDLLDMMI